MVFTQEFATLVVSSDFGRFLFHFQQPLYFGWPPYYGIKYRGQIENTIKLA
jgi:hypothetical protein